MSKRLNYLVVHQDIFVRGLGALGKTLTTEGSEGRKDLLMYDAPAEGGITIEYKGHSLKIPYGNVAVMVYKPEPLT